MGATLKPSRSRSKLIEAAETNAERLGIVSEDMEESSRSAEARKRKAGEMQMLTLNVPRDRYEEYKRLFGGAGYSLAKGTRMCLDFIYRAIQSGDLDLTESGIRESASSRLERK